MTQDPGTIRTTERALPAPAEEFREEITLFWKNLSFCVVNKEHVGPLPTVEGVSVAGQSAEPSGKTLPPPDSEEPGPPPQVLNGKPMKTIVWNLTGVARPKEIIGLLGPSGSGKTVLLNMFSDRLRAPEDSMYKRNVFVNNNVPLTRDLFGKVGAYVMQDDVLLETLTPLECLQFSANLRLSCSQEEKVKRVHKVIDDLKLQNCVNTLVGNVLKKGISGGERKRTSIGVEIVTDPSLIILDELTSGLDSFTAYTIVRVMKDIAGKGKTVIAIVHQPSTDIFNVFDRIYLLAAGREVYQGATKDLYDYFKKIGKEIPAYTNPADQLIKLMHAKEKPDPEDIKMQNELFESYDANIRSAIKADIKEVSDKAPKIDSAVMKSFRASSFTLQFEQLLIRAFRNMIRNTTFTRVRVGQIIILGVLLDILFWNKESYSYEDVKDKNGAFFFICTSQFMLSIQSVLLTFPLERGLFLREQSNRMYGVLPYYLTKTFVELPFQLFMPLLFSLIIYWAIHFRNSGECYFLFLAALLVLVFYGNSLGTLLSSMFSNVRAAFAVVPVVTLPLMLFAGYMSNVDSIVSWLAWLQYISPIRYTLEIFFRNEFRYEDFANNGNPLNPYPVDGYNYDLGTANCFICMACIGLGVRVAAFFILKLQTLNT